MSVHIETDFFGKTKDLNHPRICSLNKTFDATVSATTEASGYAAVNALTAFTYDAWKPTNVPANYEVTLGAQETLSYVALSDHTMGTNGGRVQLQEPDGSGGWDDVGPQIAPANDDPIVILFEPRDLTTFRLRFTVAAARVAVIYAGDAIEVPQRVYSSPGTPADLARQTEFEVNRAATGPYLGRSIKRSRKVANYSIEHVTEAWVRTTLNPFIEDALLYPFFFAENPFQYPDAVMFKQLEQDIRPERMGVNNLMRFTL